MERTHVKLRAKSLTALELLVHDTPLELDRPRRHLGGAVTVTAYVTHGDIVDIRDAFGVEIVSQAG